MLEFKYINLIFILFFICFLSMILYSLVDYVHKRFVWKREVKKEIEEILEEIY